MLSMMAMGRVWCGVFCPEGAATEWASRHGLQRSIPRWIRWGGWPFVAFACTTLFGQLVSVYQYPKAALLILGGSTIGALIVGFLYGRDVRVWCRFLCPANGVFTLLSKLSPVHFGVDKTQWDLAPHNTHPVDCPPILDVKHKAGTGSCHNCGRCSGHRNAVTLQWRSTAQELLTQKITVHERVEVFTLLFGLLGIALGAFQWSGSPWFVQLKQFAAWQVVEYGPMWLLSDNAPWWILTHYPEANDVFTWLDGILILFYIGATTLLVGGWMSAMMWLSARWIVGNTQYFWRLAYSVTPLGGISVFLGLSMLTLTQLTQDRITVPYVSDIRALLLAIAVTWSLWLCKKICQPWQLSRTRFVFVMVSVLLAMLPVLTLWYLQFYRWA
jgi:polyferredoxin